MPNDNNQSPRPLNEGCTTTNPMPTPFTGTTPQTNPGPPPSAPPAPPPADE